MEGPNAKAARATNRAVGQELARRIMSVGLEPSAKRAASFGLVLVCPIVTTFGGDSSCALARCGGTSARADCGGVVALTETTVISLDRGHMALYLEVRGALRL